VLDALDRPGVWHRAGMGGQVSGLDIGEALASLSEYCDRDFARGLLIVAESHFLVAFAAKQKGENPDG